MTACLPCGRQDRKLHRPISDLEHTRDGNVRRKDNLIRVEVLTLLDQRGWQIEARWAELGPVYGGRHEMTHLQADCTIYLYNITSLRH